MLKRAQLDRVPIPTLGVTAAAKDVGRLVEQNDAILSLGPHVPKDADRYASPQATGGECHQVVGTLGVVGPHDRKDARNNLAFATKRPDSQVTVVIIRICH